MSIAIFSRGYVTKYVTAQPPSRTDSFRDIARRPTAFPQALQDDGRHREIMRAMNWLTGENLIITRTTNA
jgi:hypothetical protein